MGRISTAFIPLTPPIARDYTSDLRRKLRHLIVDESRTQAITEEKPRMAIKIHVPLRRGNGPRSSHDRARSLTAQQRFCDCCTQELQRPEFAALIARFRAFIRSPIATVATKSECPSSSGSSGFFQPQLGAIFITLCYRCYFFGRLGRVALAPKSAKIAF